MPRSFPLALAFCSWGLKGAEAAPTVTKGDREIPQPFWVGVGVCERPL